MMDSMLVLFFSTIALGLPVLAGVRPTVVFAIAGVVAFFFLGLPFRMLEPMTQRAAGLLFSNFSSLAILFSVIATRFYLELGSLATKETVVPPFLSVFGGGSAGTMMADADEPGYSSALKPSLPEYLASTSLLVPFAAGPLVAAIFMEVSISQTLLATLPFAVSYGFLAHFVYPDKLPQLSGDAIIPTVLNLSPFAVAIASVVWGVATPTEGAALALSLMAVQIAYLRGGAALLHAARKGSEEAGGLFITLAAASFMITVFSLGGLTRPSGTDFSEVFPYLTVVFAACLGFGGGPIFATLVLLPFVVPFSLESGISDPIQIATAILLAGEAGRFASKRIGPSSGQAAIDSPSIIWISLLFIGSILCLLTEITRFLPDLMMGPGF